MKLFARLFSERGIPAVIYGAGPRTVLESNAKRADEHIVLEDLRRLSRRQRAVLVLRYFDDLTEADTAAALGICRSKLYELLQAGVIESVHIGASRRIPVAAMVEYVERLRQEAIA